MISTAISWYFRQRHDELWQLIAEAEKHQLELLEQYTDKLSRTIYGKNFGVKAKLNYAEFRRNYNLIQNRHEAPRIPSNSYFSKCFLDIDTLDKGTK